MATTICLLFFFLFSYSRFKFLSAILSPSSDDSIPKFPSFFNSIVLHFFLLMCYTIHKGAGGLKCRPALFAYWLMHSMAACQLSNFISLVPHLTYQYSPIGKGNHCAPFRLCRCTGFFVATLHFSCGLVTAIGCIS